MKKVEKEIKIGSSTLKLSSGNLAQQSSGCVTVSLGETVVLATVVASPLRSELDYFPLTVEYQEKLYAGGKIKGSRWVKREGRPNDDEILTARLIDRSIRPLFPKEYKKDVQVIITVLSVDLENRPEVAAGVAASAALSISNIPWDGPVGFVNIGLNKNDLIVNPTETQLQESEMDLFVTSTKKSVVMIESGLNIVDEKKVVTALKKAVEENEKVVKLIESFTKEIGKEKDKVEIKKPNLNLEKKIKELSLKEIKFLIKKMSSKEAGYSDYDELKNGVLSQFEEDELGEAAQIFDGLYKKEIRKIILSGKRPDGRKPDQIRPLSAEVGVLPRTHGSGIFNRGMTQALTITTLGAPSLEQFIETAEGEETKRYIHHYSMPPFSVGETGRIGSPSRREIGHGALAERALIPVIPPEDSFPYTIRVVTEILSSNGSTSMASTCGSSLSLMDAGVPIKSPVAGIAMGLIVDSEKDFTILTDIVGIEDGNGDMDLKVAGTENGITALQLDVKTLKLTISILEKALSQAKKARLEILSVMKKAIPSPRKNISEYAPKIKMIKIATDKIGDLIGPGGKMIKSIISQTNALVDVEDDGTVSISASTKEELDSALKMVESIVNDPEAGQIFDGVVKRVQPFGIFVEIAPGKEGMVHVSDMSKEYVKDPSSLVSVDDRVQVRVKEIDDLGRINLSMVMDPSFDKEKEERRKSSNQKRNYSDNRKYDRGRKVNYNRRSFNKSKGPHFPTTRLLDKDSR